MSRVSALGRRASIDLILQQIELAEEDRLADVRIRQEVFVVEHARVDLQRRGLDHDLEILLDERILLRRELRLQPFADGADGLAELLVQVGRNLRDLVVVTGDAGACGELGAEVAEHLEQRLCVLVAALDPVRRLGRERERATTKRKRRWRARTRVGSA